MRIVCDNCGAKYQISDDKVRNKVFKIRCKRCAHVIVVRSQGDEGDDALGAGADEESTRVAGGFGQSEPEQREPSHEAAPAPDAVWYVVVNREQVGPLTKAQIQAQVRLGEVDAEAFTWREGMADWTRLAAIPEFYDLFPAPEAAEPTAVAPAPVPQQQRSPRPAAAAAQRAPAPEPFGQNDGGFGALDQDDDVIASSHAPQSAGAEAGGGGRDPRVSGQQLRNQRNENSVLFSLDSLAAEVDRPASVRSTGGSDASGLIDISALAGGGRSAGNDDPFGGGGGFAPVSASPVGSAMPILVKRRGMSTGAVVAIVASVVLVVGGGAAAAIWYIKNQQTPVAPAQPTAGTGAERVAMGAPVSAATAATSAPASAAPAAATVASAAPSAPASTTESAAAAVPSAPESVAAVAPPSAPESEAEAAAPKRRQPATPRRTTNPITRTRAPDPEDEPPARSAAPPATPRTAAAAAPPRRGAPAGGKDELGDLLDNLGNKGNNNAQQGGNAPVGAGNRPAPSADPMLPEKLSRQQVLQVVTKNAGSIRSCGSGGGGNVTVSMLIGRSGAVEDAKATGAQAGTPVGSCVEGKVRSFRFPQFSGEPMRINMPFAL